jgi:NAD(P)-dependent dehydrogenase (short-subunit alcohol dehydrogenase family)
MSNTPKVWFITGASSGFGRALAEAVVARGDYLVATARRVNLLEPLTAKAAEQVLVLPLDVTDPEAAAPAVEAAIARFGRIDVLVNNAGYGVVGGVEETPEVELRAQLETNFFAAARLTNAVLPHFRARRSGTVVQISSMGGIMAAPGFGAYCASKFALEGWSEALAIEGAPLGIRVLIVEPGAFRTNLFGAAMRRMPVIDDYEATVGATRSFAGALDGTAAGDPAKAAAAIIGAVDSAEPPLRLVLGGDALGAIRQKLASVQAELERWESVTLDTELTALV